VQEDQNKRLFALFSYGTFHFIDDGFSDSIYILLPFIASELSLSFSQVGLLKGVATAAMSLFQIPMGLLGEKIGDLTVITAGTMGLAGGFMMLSRVYTFPLILLSLLLAKGTSGGQHSLGASALSKVFEVSGRRAAIGTYNFSGDVGKVFLPFVLTLLINLWGWRQAVLTVSWVALLVVAFLWVLTRKKIVALATQEPKEKLRLKGKSWGIRNPRGFSALLTIGVIDNTTRTALLTFLPFLLLKKGISVTQVGFALTLLFAGGAAGKLACGFLAEWLGIVPMVWGTETLTCAGMLSLIWCPTPMTWFLLPVVGFMLNGTSSVLYATVAEVIYANARSRGYGLYYAITLGSSAIAPLVYGVVTDSLGIMFTMVTAALFVLLTLPLSRFLTRPITEISAK
jgi:MFS transporter, FSR family, fosmidomycin resistance protein